MTQERRRIALVAAAVASCMVVAIASRVDVAAGTNAAFRVGPGVAQGGTVAFVVFAVLSLVLVGWAVWPQGGPRRPVRRRSWRDVVAFTIAALMLAFFLSLFDNDGAREDRLQPDSRSELGNADPPTAREDSGRRASATGSLVVALIAVVALGAAFVARRRLADHDDLGEPDPGDAATAPSTGEGRASARGAALAAAFAEPDPREAIRLAYRAAELVLAPTAARRAPTAAPREWVQAVRRSTAASTTVEPLAALVRAYEIARFSDHQPSSADRDAALGALRELDESAVAV